MSTQKELRDKFIQQGVQFIDPDTVYLREDTQIASGTIIEPFVIIGKGVKIAENCTIKGFSHLEDCTIESEVSVGPFARIRGGSVLAQKVGVGNFVELKNAHLKENVKSAHLTYLGDCSIGEDTNIGAGTITCNYDGYNKHHTTIGKECFIGSNTTFIAPLQIGDKALIAAGSVITQDIPSNALAVSRPELKAIPNGAAKIRARAHTKP